MAALLSGPVGFQYPDSGFDLGLGVASDVVIAMRRVAVFVDHTAEEVCPRRMAALLLMGIGSGRGSMRSLPQGTRRTVTIEMIGVDPEHGFQMASGEGQ
ncbi:hypothetical protein [Actinomadura sp. WMMA1423]|uniref:hypothetical protein n=1 Tax=Actinomadura sp. WMMA1423 TaxID=2591108 RepID=UPI00197AB0D8|nr:hypothetical protein [Actinomadura sp. WMMA1423]